MTKIIYSKDGADQTHKRIPPLGFLSGRYWNGLEVAANPIVSESWAGVRVMAYPVIVPVSGMLDEIGVMVMTGAAGAKLLVGLYAADGADGKPGTRLVTSTELDCSTSTTGVSDNTVSYAIKAGTYWAAVGTNGTACATRTMPEYAFQSLGFSGISEPFRLAIEYTTGISFETGLPASLAALTPSILSAGLPHGIRFKIT